MHENQGILLIITNGGKWHYLAVKILSAFLRGITSNHKKDLLFNFFFTHILQKPMIIAM